MKVVLEANLIAVLAFAFSTTSLAWQAAGYFRGAQVTVEVGDRVNLVPATHPLRRDTPLLMINARIDYLNSGAVGRDAVVTDERLTIHVDGAQTYEYRWMHFENVAPSPDDWTPAYVGTRVSAHSVLVPGAGAVSHQTTFAGFNEAQALTPASVSAPMPWADLRNHVAEGRRIVFEFTARGPNDQVPTYRKACAPRFTETVRELLDARALTTIICPPAAPQPPPSPDEIARAAERAAAASRGQPPPPDR